MSIHIPPQILTVDINRLDSLILTRDLIIKSYGNL